MAGVAQRIGAPWAEDTTIVFIVGLVTLPTPVRCLAAADDLHSLQHLREQFHYADPLLSRRLTLNAVVVFLAVLVWGWLWGISGALMAVPLLAVLKVIADRIDGLAGLSEFLGGREQPQD